MHVIRNRAWEPYAAEGITPPQVYAGRREFLGRLAADILDEEVREVIGTDVQEWIDLAMQADIESETAAKRSDRDASLPRPANWRRDASDRPEGEATDAIR